METLLNNATNETNLSEDWACIMEICDLADTNAQEAENAIKGLVKRLQHKNVSVQLSALKVADALAKNCKLQVKMEISSRWFLDALEAKIKASNTHETLRNNILLCIQQWAQDFAKNPELVYVADVYKALKGQGYHFSSPEPEKQVDSRANSAKEREDLQLALALSLSENSASAQQQAKKVAVSTKDSHPQKLFSVQALYDFIAREEGELALTRGDTIDVWDATTYQSWWKGISQSGKVGIFPSNYVQKLNSPDAAATAPKLDNFVNTADSTNIAADEAQINELLSKVGLFQQLLRNVNPTSDSLFEHEQLLQLHNEFVTARPKLIRLIEELRRKKNEIENLQVTLEKSLDTHKALFHTGQAISQAPQGYPTHQNAQLQPNGSFYQPNFDPNTRGY